MKDSLALCFASGENVSFHFMMSVIQFMAHDSRDRRLLQQLMPQEGFFVEDNRNVIVQRFLESDIEWSLWFDTDNIFAVDLAYALFDAADPVKRPIVAALCFGQHLPPEVAPLWFLQRESGLVNPTGFKVGDMVQLDAVGMNGVLVHRSVYQKMAADPQNGAEGWEWFYRRIGIVNGMKMRLGEDVGFCLRARELGFPIIGHSAVQVRHLKRMVLDFDLFRRMLEGKPK